jgi:hypothetical protein
MAGARGLTLLVALVSAAGSLAGCGQTVGYPGALPPAHTRSYPSETASPLPAGTDALTGLLGRPMRPPAPAPNATCWASSDGDLKSVAPDYGAGAGPAYLSGQDTWYAGGQVAIVMVDARYSGPLLVRPFQLGGNGKLNVTLDFPSDLSPSNSVISSKELQHGVTVVGALATTGGGMFLAPAAPSSLWRASFSRLSTDGPGCFGFQVDGDDFTEFIVFEVNAGSPPPG